MAKRLLWLTGFFLIQAFFAPKALAQTFSYTQGGLSVNVVVSHPCDGSTSNGFIRFDVLSVNSGAGATKAQLVLISGPNEFFFPPGTTGEINVGSSYTYIPPANQAGTYDFVIRDNRSSGADVISTPAPGAPFGVTLVDLPDLVINQENLTDNSNCASPNGQVVASVDGGSKTPTLAPTAGSFSYTWSSNNGLTGLPLSGTYNGVADLDLAALLGRTGLPAGTYTLSVDDAYSVCTETRDFTIIDPSPLVFNVSTITPTLCLGSAGSVQLSSSEGAIVNYEVYLNGNPTGINQNGNGGALSFAIPAATLNAAGTYNFTIRAVNGQCTPAFMNGTAIITVNPTSTASVLSGSSSICIGQSADLNVAITGGTSPYTVTYFNGTSNVAVPNYVSGSAITVSPTGTTTYSLVSVVDANGCSGTGLTGTATVTVNPLPNAPTAGNVTVCFDGAAHTGTATAGAGETIVWYTAASGGSVTVAPSGTAVGTYTAFAASRNTTTLCESATRTAVTVTINALPNPPTAGNVTVCFDGSAHTGTATAGAGETIVWYTAASGGSVTVAPSGTAVGTYTAFAASRNTTTLCESATRTAITVTINALPNAPTAGNVTVCFDGSAHTGTATAGAGETIVWYTAASGGSVTVAPSGTAVGTYTAFAASRNTTTLCESATRTAVTVTINALPNPPTAGNVTVCFNGAVHTGTATAGAGETIVWYTAASGGSVTVAPSGTAVGTYTAFAASRNTTTLCESAMRTGVTVTINALPTAPTAGNVTVCFDGSGHTGTATAGAGETIVWYTAASGGSVTVAPSGTAVGTYTAFAASRNTTTFCESANRTPVTVTINALPNAPTAGNVTVCFDGVAHTGTATAGAGETIVWYTAASGGSVTVAPSGTAVGTYTAFAASRNTTTLCESAMRTAVTVTINALPNAPTAGNVTVCFDGAAHTGTATAGAGETIVWYTAASGGSVTVAPSGTAVGTYTAFAASRNTTTLCENATRTAVTVTINALPNAPTAGNVAVCFDGAAHTSTATAGAGETIVWYTAASGGSVTVAPSGTAVGTYTAFAASRNTTTLCESATRTQVTVTINALPTAPTAGNVTVCFDGSAHTGTATAGAGETIVWYTAASGGSVTVVPSGTAVGTYTAFAASRNTTTFCESATRTPVTVSINALPNAPTAGNVTVCFDGSAHTGTATAGAGETIVWYTAASGGSVTVAPSGTAVGTYTAFAASQNTTTLCESATRTPVTVTINVLPTTPTAGNVTVCFDGSAHTGTATAGAGETIVWYTAASGGSVTVAPSGTAVGTYTAFAASRNTTTLCESATRTPVTVTINALPNAPTAGNVTVCFDGSAHTGTATAGAGETIVWYTAASGGSITVAPSGTAVGTYTAFAASRNTTTLCESATRTAVTVTINALPTAPTAGNVTVCFNGAVHTGTATAGAGETIVWYTAASGGSVTVAPSGTAVGTYTAFAASQNTTTLCESATRTPVTVTIDALPNAPTAGDVTVCFDGAAHTGTATAGAGEIIVWYTAASGGSVTVSPSGTAVGTYTAFAASRNTTTLCESATRTPVTVTINANPTFTFSKTDVSNCVPGNDGSITITASGGNGSYQYSVDGGANFLGSNVFTGLVAGNYNVVVQDGNSCQSVISIVTIGSPAGINASLSVVDNICQGGNIGSITVTANGGDGNYTYSKDNGANFQVSNVFTGLTADTYPIVVRDGGGCQFISSGVVGEPAAVAFTFVSSDVTCNASLDGSITISATGGDGSYTYSKDGGANFQGSTVFSSLAPGSYSVQVKDGAGCLSPVVMVTIVEPNVVSFTATVTDATTCSPGNDGSISIVASGGSGSFEYSIDNGANFQMGDVFSGLLPGSYSVVVRDGNGCLAPVSVETVSTPGNVTFTTVQTDITCNGSADGIIAVNASGGNGTYNYSKDGGTSFHAGSSFTGLSSGSYNIVVRDGLGCLSPIVAVSIAEPTAVTFVTSKTDATACGSSDGSITVTPTGGTGQYFASMDNGANFIGPSTTFTFSALAAGNYSIVVKDQNNCQTAATVVAILAPGSLSFSSVNQDVTCFGGNNGSITITASGGSGIYTYSKDNGVNFQASNVFSGLAANMYQIVVNDGSGCQFVGSVLISQPIAISVSESHTNLTCNGDGSGSISITASGGTGVLQYSINNGAAYLPSSSFTGLAAGNYNVLVRDANNCVSTAIPLTLTEPTAVTFTSSSTNPTLCASSDGSIMVTPAGGNGTYFASIDNGANFTGPSASFAFAGLSAGSYNVIVRDGNNCQSAVINIVLNSGSGISATFSKTDVTCFGGSNGTISISASGGTGVYSYSIDNGANFFGSATFNGLTAGTYAVVARDGLGCTFSGSVTINQTTAVTFTTTQVDVVCNGTNTGSITVSASGGNNLFQYSNDNGGSFQGSKVFGSLAAGSYSILVKDGNNCTSAVSVVSITEPVVLSFTTSKTDASSCLPGNDGSITVNASGGSGSYQYSRDGGSTYQVSNTFTGLSATTYSIVVQDGNACTTAATSVTIATPTPPDATFSGLAASYCTTNSNVTLTPMLVGGTFSGTGVTGNSFSPSTAGAGTFNIQYTITVNGCTSSTTQSVTVTTSTVDASFSGLNFVYCANASVATLTPTTAGGTFSGPGVSGSTFDPATAGPGQHTVQYMVTSGGCTGTTSKIVTVLAATDPLCTGSVGTGTCTSVIITPKPSPATCTNSDGRIVFSIKPFVPLVNNTGVTISIVGTSITNQSISRTNFNDSTFNTLPVGTYNYTIEYGDPSCIKTGTVTIDQSGTVGTPVASNVVNPTCAGATTGSVVIDVPGETGNTLEWSIDGVTWTPFICGTAITGLPQGPSPSFQHLVSVRRNSSDPCNGGVLVTMQDVAGAITFSEVITNATCANNDGSIQIGGISGGTQPYSYSFDGASLATLPSNDTFTGLAAGDYDFVVTDANACSLSRTITVTFPGVVVITPVVLNPDCSGNGLNGAITVTVNSLGNFNVGISNDPQVPPTSFTNVTSGGTAVVNFPNKTKGTYYITAQSTANLCPVTTAVSILGGPTSVDFVATTNNVLCFEELGVIQLNAITGEAGMSYGYEVLSSGNPVKSGAITALEALGPVDIGGLNQGVYQVRLFQNQAACTSPIYSANKSLTIDGPDAALDTLAVSRIISLPDQPTGLMNIVVEESGQEPYEFKLELIDPLFDEQSMPAIDWTQMNRSNQTLKIEQEVGSLFAGVYTLSLRDGFGCEKSYAVEIGVNTDLFIPNIFTPNDDGANEEFYIRNLPGNSKVVITDRWGKEIFASGNYKNDWRGGDSPDGIYYYKIIIGSETYSGWVEILRGQ